MNGTFEKPSTQQTRGTVYVLYYENKLRSNLMPVKYQNVWRTLNDLESVTSKVSSANEILNCALDSLENHKYDKVENLIYATQEFLEYYLNEFDKKFKDAWAATVGDLRDGDVMEDFDKVLKEEGYEYTPLNQVRKWNLPLEVDGPSGEYYVTLPDDLLQAANLNEGDYIEFKNNYDGSFTCKNLMKTIHPEG